MLRDLGIAIHNKHITFNEELTISITLTTLVGQQLRCTGNSVEMCQEVMGYMGSFIFPISHNQLLKQLREDGLVSFQMVSVGELIVLNRIDSMRPILCRMVSR